MTINIRFLIFILSMGIIIMQDRLIGMIGDADSPGGGEAKTAKAREHDREIKIGARSVSTDTDDLLTGFASFTLLGDSSPTIPEPLLRLAHHIDQAGEEDLLAVKALVKAGVHDVYIQRLIDADKKPDIGSAFFHAQKKYLTDKSCTLSQRAVLRKMLAVLAGVAEDSKMRIQIMHPHDRLCFAVAQGDVDHVTFLVDNKICDVHKKNEQGTNIVFFAKTLVMTKYLVEVCKIVPIFKGNLKEIRHANFAVVRNGREWVVVTKE